MRDMMEIRSAISQMTSMVVVSKENTAGAIDTLLPDTKDDEEQKTDSDQRESNFYHNFGISRFARRGLVKSQQGIKLFGIVDVVISSRENTTTTSLCLGLPTWIYARRFELHLMKTCQGWDQSLRSYRTVSYDAEVFHHCMAGNVTGLQGLFESGQASPFEMDPEGRTPLHVRLHLETYL